MTDKIEGFRLTGSSGEHVTAEVQISETPVSPERPDMIPDGTSRVIIRMAFGGRFLVSFAGTVYSDAFTAETITLHGDGRIEYTEPETHLYGYELSGAYPDRLPEDTVKVEVIPAVDRAVQAVIYRHGEGSIIIPAVHAITLHEDGRIGYLS